MKLAPWKKSCDQSRQRIKKKRHRMRWLDSITDLMDMSFSKLREFVTVAMKLKDVYSLEVKL